MNFYETQGVVYGRAFMATVLAALKTVPGAALIVAGKIRLSKDPAFAPTVDSVITDFTANEADFTGYTAGGYTVTLSAPLNQTTQILAVLCNALAIGGSPFTVPNTIYGYWIDDGTNVVMAEKFAPPGATANFANTGDYLDLQVLLPIPMLVVL